MTHTWYLKLHLMIWLNAVHAVGQFYLISIKSQSLHHNIYVYREKSTSHEDHFLNLMYMYMYGQRHCILPSNSHAWCILEYTEIYWHVEWVLFLIIIGDGLRGIVTFVDSLRSQWPHLFPVHRNALEVWPKQRIKNETERDIKLIICIYRQQCWVYTCTYA